MKILISSTGDNLESLIDPRFGRAAYFIIVDTDSMEFEVINNKTIAFGGGAGVKAAQTVVDKDVAAVITGNMGPNAMNVLQKAQIDIFKGFSETVRANVEEFKKGLLEKIDTAVPPHFGMGRGGR